MKWNILIFFEKFVLLSGIFLRILLRNLIFVIITVFPVVYNVQCSVIKFYIKYFRDAGFMGPHHVLLIADIEASS